MLRIVRRLFFPFGAFVLALVGCGGSGGGGTTAIDPIAPTEQGTAKFSVDVATGKVAITPLETGSTKSAVLGGSAVTFETTTLLAEDGEVGRRAVKVRLKNNLPEAIGVGRPIRIQFGVFGPSTSYPTDVRSMATVSTLLRDLSGGGYQDGPASTARITTPNAVAIGKDGSIYFNGTDNRIRKLSDGYVSTVAQNVPAAGLAYLTDALSGREYLIAACPTLHSIKLVPIASGSVTTWAGADSVSGFVNGTATTARFSFPNGLAIDASLSQVLVADTSNGAIRAIPFSFVGGNLVAGTVATRYSALSHPSTVHVSENRSVAVSETGVNRVRIFNAGSSREAIFGGTDGNLNGDGNLARFSGPRGITSIGNTFYVADGNNYQIRRIELKDGAAPLLASNWTVSVLAGNGSSAFADGPGTTAGLRFPFGLATDAQSRLIVADTDANGIRRIASEGSYDFGTPTGSSTGQASLIDPTGYADRNGLLRPYIDIDARVEPGQTIDIGKWVFAIPSGLTAFNFAVTVETAPETYAGLEAVLNPTGGVGSPNVVAQFLSRGASGGALFGRLENVSFSDDWGQTSADALGNRFIVDSIFHTVRRISKAGMVTLVAGKVGTSGTANGLGSAARFNYPTGVRVNNEGTELMISEEGGNTIRRISLVSETANAATADSWNVATIAGAAAAGDVNGLGGAARFRSPRVIVGPSNDDLYVLESDGARLRSVQYLGGPRDSAASWSVSVAAGSEGGVSGYVDGLGSSARFNSPTGAAYAPDGTIYITDGNNYRVRAFNTVTRSVTTVAGSGTQGQNDNANALSAQFIFPCSVAVDSFGAVFISDLNSVRRLYDGAVKTVAGNGTGAATTGDEIYFNTSILGLALDPKGDLIFVNGSRLVRLTRKLGR
jgi:sugar lactone lactonase YvrE